MYNCSIYLLPNYLNEMVESTNKSEYLTCRVNSSIVIELLKFGNKSTVGCDIITDFIGLKQYEASIPESGVIFSLDQAHIYPKFIDRNLYHVTFKKGDESLVVELDREKMAHLALEIVALINKDVDKQ